ncbi:MAG: OmpA family protein [Cyclobacteriaceae bacterium]
MKATLSLLCILFVFNQLTAQVNFDLAPSTAVKENLGLTINTPFTETKPLISHDGTTLYFCRQNYQGNFRGQADEQDIYFASLEDTQWSSARNLGWPLNDQHPNGVSSISTDGNTLLLINQYIKEGGAKKGASISRRTKDGWSFPEKIRIDDFYNYSPYVDYFLEAQNKVLLLAVHRQDSHGDQDLYVSFKESNYWSKPLNMGAAINTSKADFAPFLAADGKTLYFASEGHDGLGGSDIYYSKRLDESWIAWSEPVNLGPAINTQTWDAYYSVSAKGDYAYFVSKNPSNYSKDIYRLALRDENKPEPVVMISGQILSNEQKLLLSGILNVIDTTGKALEAQYESTDGNYKFVLPAGTKYNFQILAPGYLIKKETLNLTKHKSFKDISHDFMLTPLALGEKIPLQNIFFTRSQPTLIDASYKELQYLVDFLKINSTVEIELGGHTDNIGIPQLNLELSQKRVDGVKAYLVSKGIDENRLLTKAYGGSKPIASNTSEDSRKKNRRVEFTILKL